MPTYLETEEIKTEEKDFFGIKDEVRESQSMLPKPKQRSTTCKLKFLDDEI